MQKFTIEEARAACEGRYLAAGEGYISGVTIDSRSVGEGMLFVPVAGERVDGHDYIEAAFKAGASASLCSKADTEYEGGAVIGVDDTVSAIGMIARAYKKKYNIPTVGITGSVGKTTTKDMICLLYTSRCV